MISDKALDDVASGIQPSLNQHGLNLYSPDPAADWQKFIARFKIVEAAGGLVFNTEKKLLMIYRNKKWDLPKGKTDEGETSEQTALREVCEETGVCNLELREKFDVTFHTYTDSKKNILKKTHWYIMNCSNSSAPFKLQTEEGIEDAAWMNKQQVDEAMKNTFASIKMLVLKIYA